LVVAAARDPAVADLRAAFLDAMDRDIDTPAAMPALEALADLALASGSEAIAAQAGWMVRELGARILGLRLASVPTPAVVAAG
jgi:hypothetical protein